MLQSAQTFIYSRLDQQICKASCFPLFYRCRREVEEDDYAAVVKEVAQTAAGCQGESSERSEAKIGPGPTTDLRCAHQPQLNQVGREIKDFDCGFVRETIDKTTL